MDSVNQAEERPVKPLGDSNRHYWLAKSMAQATGADIVGAHEAGRLSQEDWAQMVQACRGCDWVAGCVRWLQRTPSASDVPETCANCGRFSDLRRPPSTTNERL